MSPRPRGSAPEPSDTLATRHLRLGWWGLLVFALGGAALETLHAIKAPSYLDAGHETTRLLFRLAHAHGALLSIVNIAYALTMHARPETAQRSTSNALALALVLLPVGFFAGGLGARGGDPGLGVILVPIGAISFVVAVAQVARRV